MLCLFLLCSAIVKTCEGVNTHSTISLTTRAQARKRAVVAAALEEGREGANEANKLTMEVRA